MQSTNILCLCMMVLFPCACYGIAINSYGPGVGDQKLGAGADPSSNIKLNDHYIFFGEDYDQQSLYISDNGYVTFGSGILTNNPKPFPIKTGSYHSQKAKMVAPYWSDVDTRCGGYVWYREVNDLINSEQNLFVNIYVKVRDAGIAQDFLATSAVVVTWEGVTCQNGIPCENELKNTFQLVIATDGLRTMVIFYYKHLEWQKSDMNRGPAWAGVNCGDRMNGFNVTSKVEDMIEMRLVSMTNCDAPGAFVYRVDPGISSRVQAILMSEMMQYSMAAGSMEFGVAEAELYSPYSDVSASQFNRRKDVHLEEYVGGLTAANQELSFVYFGSPDDSNLGKGDETTSGKVFFDKPVHFYGKVYASAKVYTDGIVVLGDSDISSPYVPKELTSTNVPIVAPFFADVDTKGDNSGLVYYRGTTDSSILDSAKTTIESVYPHAASFEPVYAFIVTWDKVGYYKSHDDKVNSFQVIIATDSTKSYVIINYKKIEWTSPDSTGVSPGAGLGAPANKLPVMGISDGHSHQQLVTLDGAYSNDQAILKAAVDNGNSGSPGLWVFEASATAGSSKTAVQVQQYSDPKLQHLGDEEQQDIDSLASELQSVNKIVG